MKRLASVVVLLAILWVALTGIGAEASIQSRPNLPVRRTVAASFQLMLIYDKATRDCYGCSSAALAQSNWGLVSIRRFTQLAKAGPTRTQMHAMSDAVAAMHWWGLAGFLLANNSDGYDLYAHRAIRNAWRAAGQLALRPSLAALFLAAGCGDWYLAASTSANVPITACDY
jgi:hypothetical protein